MDEASRRAKARAKSQLLDILDYLCCMARLMSGLSEMGHMESRKRVGVASGLVLCGLNSCLIQCGLGGLHRLYKSSLAGTMAATISSRHSSCWELTSDRSWTIMSFLSSHCSIWTGLRARAGVQTHKQLQCHVKADSHSSRGVDH